MKSLKELRDHNNLSRKEVAQHIGVSDRVYAYYEQGRTLPAKYVKPLANLFGISCDEFLENNTDTLDWEREFGCIERTERLELPTWEEIQSNALYNVYFTTPEIEVYRLIFNTTREIITISVQDENFDFENRWLLMETYKLTKENYTLACRKAKELFLKGNVND